MIERLKCAVPGLGVSLLAGALGHYFFCLEYWSTTVIVTIAIIANGFIATWEDKGTFND